ncbi:DNA-3-methyladenine glycosylase I [Kordiimonas gwangyangensis]|uniref:DNA-3-methyladenine glycosylase I n=1 Tax=Kordiimonas gwangyangensis TaxID=288022 RepID=UPI0003704598|nr:DNA-3-methyladenine glycosylase I [Kordiimonas gwangyangensis]
MRTYDEIFAIAVERKGSVAAVEAQLPQVKSADEITAIGDDRILAGMTRAIFQAGFSWKVIDAKWPGFEEAFEGFVPVRWKFMSDDDLDDLLKDKRIVRNGPKIMTVRDNAILLCDLEDEYGSAAKCIADWPMEDFVGLLEMLKKRGSRLGGNTGPYFLRFLGKDGWVLGRDGVAALIREGVVDKEPTGKGALRAVQEAFNEWAADSGRSFAQISRTLAMSIDT